MGNGIGWAVKEMGLGNKVCRAGWNGKGMWLMIESFPDRQPCVTMKTAPGPLQPGWLCSQADLLATDWELAT